MRRRRLILIAGLLLVGVAIWAGQGLWGDRPARYNVLLITLDTTCADRLGCYGHTVAHTPALDALAASGVRFTKAYTHAPLTLPSHASILTGLLPPEHGLHDNGRGRLRRDLPTLAELSSGQGYRTAAFLASFVLDKRFGLNRGFEVYDDRMAPPRKPGDLFGMENPANVVADRALSWLEQHADQPFFCWVHFFDPHLPYAPPEPYRSLRTDAYDGEIAFMDSHVRRLLDFVLKQGLYRKTLIVVCGDHGEAFGKHNEYGHGPLVYDTTMHVPLILVLPGRIPKGKVEDKVVGLTDIAPTVLELLGWAPLEKASGRSLLARSEGERSCYGESEFVMHNYGWAPLYSLVGPRWKYIECPEPELYDLRADPAEQKNVLAGEPEAAASLRAQLQGLRRTMRTVRAPTVELDQQALKALRDLGYLGGAAAGAAPVDPGKRKDPKRMMDIYNACIRAAELAFVGRHRKIIDLLAPLSRRSPESLELHRRLSESYCKLLLLDQAKQHIEAYLALNPSDRGVVTNLGSVLLLMRKPSEAIKVFRHGLRLPQGPLEPVTDAGGSEVALRLRTHMAVAYEQLGKFGPAIEQWRLACKADPTSPLPAYSLAWLLATSPDPKLRDAQEAVKLAEAARDKAGEDARVLDTLAAAYAAAARFGEAIPAARKALGLARKAGDARLAAGIQERLALYAASKPYHLPRGPVVGHDSP